MQWRTDKQATQKARALFDGHRPTVYSNGSQYVVQHTPYGRVELLPLQQGKQLLLAAETPPDQGTRAVPPLSPEIMEHLSRNHLMPWRVLPRQEIGDLLMHIAHPDAPVQDDGDGVESASLLGAMEPTPPLVGEERRRLAERLGPLIAARRRDDPLPWVTGMAGVGRHTLVGETARRLKLRPRELRLNPIMVDRMLATPQESLVDTLLVACSQLTVGDLLVVSDAELIAVLPSAQRRPAIAELARVPRVVMLADAGTPIRGRLPNTIVVNCPGLRRREEARALIVQQWPDLKLEDAALTVLLRTSTVRSVGVLPSRLLYLLRLSRVLPDRGRAPQWDGVCADDAAAATAMTRPAWEQTGDDREECP